MIVALKQNWHAIFLAIALLVYTAKLVRSERINTRIGVGWLVTLVLFIIFSLTGRTLAGAAMRLHLPPAPDLGLAVLLAWLALVHINSHVRISALTVKLKLVDQEVALLQTRVDQLAGAAPMVPPAPGTTSPAPAASAPTAPAPLAPVRPLATLTRGIIGCAWIAVAVFAFGVLTGFIPPQTSGAQVLNNVFDQLKAEYQH